MHTLFYQEITRSKHVELLLRTPINTSLQMLLQTKLITCGMELADYCVMGYQAKMGDNRCWTFPKVSPVPTHGALVASVFGKHTKARQPLQSCHVDSQAQTPALAALTGALLLRLP